MINTEELNSRILENEEHILLIFDNSSALKLYKDKWGRDYRKLLYTIYDINHDRLVGLRYKAWYVVSATDLHDMIVSGKDLYRVEE